MFNLLVNLARPEPSEIWTAAERTGYEQYAADKHCKAIRSASLTAASLLLVCVLIPLCTSSSVPCTSSDAGQSLVFLAFALLLWLVVKVAMVYFSCIAVAEAQQRCPVVADVRRACVRFWYPIPLELASRAKVET